MRRVKLVAFLIVSSAFSSAAQDPSEASDGRISLVEAVSALTGADDPEEMDEYEVERLASLMSSPLRLNSVSLSRLASSGLMTAYQAASLVDYRTRHGDIMSYGELSAVDGFGEDFVRRIKPFVSLDGGTITRGTSVIRNEVAVKGGFSQDSDEQGQWNYGLKYGFEGPGGISAGLALSRSKSAARASPDAYTGYFEWEPRRLPVRIIAGDFNARFGQGLALWNGMSMSGLTSPSTLMRRASGYSHSSSFTGNYSMTGIAVTGVVGKHFVLNGSVALPGLDSVAESSEELSLLPSFNLTWNHRTGQIGLTHYADCRPWNGDMGDMNTSLDMAWCFRGTDVFAEVAYDWAGRLPAGLAGISFPAGEWFRAGFMLRAYPAGYNASWSGAQRSTSRCTDEYSATAAVGFISGNRKHDAGFSADLAYFPEPKVKGCENNRQLAMQASWSWTSDHISVKTRIKERIRDWGLPYRTDMRVDFIYDRRRLSFVSRVNILHCDGLGLLAFTEASFKSGAISSWLRAGIFRVDDWDDRIYVYERDAPGNFNVPAFYGRGVWVSAVASWKFSNWGKVYARASHTSYPFMKGENRKPGRTGLGIQCVMSF